MIKTIIQLGVNTLKGTVSLEINYVVLASVGLLFAGIILVFFLWRRRRFRIVEFNIELSSGLPKLQFRVKRDDSSLYLANRIYIELVTRKVILPFEEGRDVLVELYNSYYKLFELIRSELKSIPGADIRSSPSSRELMTLSIEILNQGLRPHLTTYQAAFRKWYSNALEEKAMQGLSPQKIQEQYPEYDMLIANLRQSQQVLQQYIKGLEQLIRDRKTIL